MEEEIYKAATRRAVKWGVPVRPLMWVILAALMLGTWGMLLLKTVPMLLGHTTPVLVMVLWMPSVAAVAACIILWMRAITREDDQRLDQMVRAAKLRWRHRSGLAFWRCRTYPAISYDGTSNAWLP